MTTTALTLPPRPCRGVLLRGVPLPADFGKAPKKAGEAGIQIHYVASKLGMTGFQASCADLDILRRTRLLDEIYPHPQLDTAPVIPVPTDGTAPVMIELHRKLAAGMAPAEALAAVQRAAADNADYAAAVGFVCFGAG